MPLEPMRIKTDSTQESRINHDPSRTDTSHLQEATHLDLLRSNALRTLPRLLIVSLVLLFGLATTYLVVIGLNESTYEQAHARFQQLSERLLNQTRQRSERTRYGLTGIRGLYAASESVTRSEFDAFVASRDVSEKYPGVIGIGFIQRIMRSEIDSFVATERADNAPEFHVWDLASKEAPVNQHPDLYVIKHCFPEDRNASAWGFDVGSEPIRREAIERAVMTGEFAISGRLTLVQDVEKVPSVLYYLPVYKPGTDPKTPQERLDSLLGIAYAPVNLKHAMVDVNDSSLAELDIAVYEGEEASQQSQLYKYQRPVTDGSSINHQDHQTGPMFETSSFVHLGGRIWTFKISSTPMFDASLHDSNTTILAISGIVISFLGAGCTFILLTGRSRAVTLAMQMTADLSAAKAQADRLAEIARRTHNAVIITDPKGLIEWVNEGFSRISGYTLEEVKGRKPGDILQGVESDPQVGASLGRAVRKGVPHTAEIVNYTKDGRPYLIRIELTPLRNAQGELTGFMAIESDVTEQHRAAQSLQAERERLDLAISATGLGMWDWNPQTSKVIFDERWAAMIGYRLDEIESDVSSWYQRVHPDDLDGAMKAVQDSLQHDHPYVCEHRLRHKDGSWRWILDQGRVAARDQLGNPIRVVGTHLDITDRRRVEDELRGVNAELIHARRAAEMASRAKSAFLANMSHEIRTPLTAILGFTSLMKEDWNNGVTKEQQTELIDTIHNAGAHLLTLINDILDLSKIEADKMVIERIQTPVIKVVREVESLLRPRAQGKGITLSASLTDPIPELILSDPTRLRQILMNLVGNAVKFTENGSINIIISSEGIAGCNSKQLVIDVQDTGSGMTNEQASRLFHAFAQADETVTRKHGGTGLGLTICRRLATMMGGDVKVLRTQPGVGSCFRLVLPLHAVHESSMVTDMDSSVSMTLAPTLSTPVTLNGRILLAEDGPDNQRLITFHLRKAGAEVVIAENGRIALDLYEKAQANGTPFDLLVTDMQMPEMDGYTLTRELRARGSSLAIIALTAYAMAEDRAKCLDAGCDDYAAKPIDKPALMATCAAWICKKSPLGQHKSLAA